MTGRADFRQNLSNAFSSEELETLCNDLGVDPDLIPGKDQGKDYWVNQLIIFFERRTRITDLQTALKAARPNVDWVYTPQQTPESVMSATPSAQPIPIGFVAGGLGLLVVLVGVLVIWLGSLRPAATPSLTPQPTLAATPCTPQPMKGTFRVVVADFGWTNGRDMKPSVDGKRLSELIANSLDIELSAANVGTLAAQVFQPKVLDSSRSTDTCVDLSAIHTMTDAQTLAQTLRAQMVIFGSLVQTDTANTTAQLPLQFYVAPLANSADEIIGEHRLGQPIPVRLPLDSASEMKANIAMVSRQKLLSNFTLGLMYDLFGQPAQALAVFTQTEQAVLATGSFTQGLEVLYFFTGREHLMLNNDVAAEAAFNQALSSNPSYMRAYIGLGDTYFRRAALLTETQVLNSEWLTKSFDAYDFAYRNAGFVGAGDSPNVATKAALGLALIMALKGEAYYLIGDEATADPLLRGAIPAIQAALNALGDKSDGQRRILANAHSYLGLMHWYHARIVHDKNVPDEVRSYDQAIAAFKKCIELDDGSDDFLKKEIADLCRYNLSQTDAERPSS